MAVVIDHRVAKQAVKPRHGAFLIADLCAPLQSLYECRLEYIFSGSPGFNPGLEERQELLMMVHQALDRFSRERS